MGSVELIEIRGYKIVRKIGEGGMGVVYEAVQESLGRSVALKVLKDELANDRWFVERFLREARAAAAIDHPNITRVYTAGNAGSTYFIAMEFLRGKTVAEMLAQSGCLSLETACEIAAQVAEGLAHAHACGVVHRDIKPANIMVTTTGVVKIMDMGLAKRLTAETKEGLTLTGQVMGTPQYMSPEQIRDSRGVGPATDVYGLGATLYHMLFGEAPFSGKSVGEIMVKVATKAVRFPRRAQEIPPPLRHLLKRMMAREARLRPTAEEVARQLRRMLAMGFTVVERRTTVQTEAPSRKRSVTPVAVLVLAVLAVFLVAWLLLHNRPPPPVKQHSPKTIAKTKPPMPAAPPPSPREEDETDAVVAAAKRIAGDIQLSFRQRLDEIDNLMVQHPAAKEQLQKIKDDLHRKCEETTEQAIKEANSLAEQGRYEEALGILEKAAVRLDGTPAAEKVKKGSADILTQARRDLDSAISELERRLAEGAQNAEKIKHIARMLKEIRAKWGWLLKKEEGKEARKRLGDLLTRVEEVKKRQRREEVERRAAELWQKAEEAFKAGRLDEARDLVAELRAERFSGCDVVRRNFGAMVALMRQIAARTSLPKAPSELTVASKLLGLPEKMLRKTKDGFVLTAGGVFKDRSAEKMWERVGGFWRCRDGFLVGSGRGAKISFRIPFIGDVSCKLRLRVEPNTTFALLVCDEGRSAYAGYINFSSRQRLRIDDAALDVINKKKARCLVLETVRLGWLTTCDLPDNSKFYSASKRELKPAREYEVRLERTGERIRLYIGGSVAFSATDKSLNAGRVSVYVVAGTVKIARFQIKGRIEKGWLEGLRQNSLAQKYQRLKRLYEGGGYGTMLQEVDRLISTLGAGWAEWCWRGIALLMLNRWEEAIICLDKSLKAKESYQAHYWLGAAYLRLRNYTKALDALKRSLALESRNKEGWKLLAVCGERLGLKRDVSLARRRAAVAPSANLLPITASAPPYPVVGTASITGRVLDKNGDVVQDAVVVVVHQGRLLRTHTDANGSFALIGLQKGAEVTLRVYKSGLGYATKRVKAPASGVEIRMTKAEDRSNLSERRDMRSRVRELEKFAKRNYPEASRQDLRRLHEYMREAAKDPVNPEEALGWWERGLKARRNVGKTEMLRGMLKTWERWRGSGSFPWRRR